MAAHKKQRYLQKVHPRKHYWQWHANGLAWMAATWSRKSAVKKVITGRVMQVLNGLRTMDRGRWTMVKAWSIVHGPSSLTTLALKKTSFGIYPPTVRM